MPNPNFFNLWICYVTWQRSIKNAEGVKVANLK